MPIGAQNHGIATGPDVGPRIVDPRAAVTQGVTVPTGISVVPLPMPDWLREGLETSEVGYYALQLHVGPCTLFGWSLTPRGDESGIMEFALIDGRSIADPVIAAGQTSGGVDRAWFGPEGLALQNGLYLVWDAGSTALAYQPAGSVFLR